jgi:hypothetical protein
MPGLAAGSASIVSDAATRSMASSPGSAASWPTGKSLPIATARGATMLGATTLGSMTLGSTMLGSTTLGATTQGVMMLGASGGGRLKI